MRRASWVWCAAWLVACSGEGGSVDAAPVTIDAAAPDAPVIDAAAPDADIVGQCLDDITAWREIVAALPQDCTADPDCALVAGPPPPAPCDSVAPRLGVSCGGVAVQAAAYAASEGPAIEAHFASLACPCEYPLQCITDCTFNRAACVEGQCTTLPPLCWCNPPEPCP